MSSVRHSIDRNSLSVDKDGRTFGFCSACKQACRAFTYVHISKKGERKVTYRCGNKIAQTRRMKKAARPTVSRREEQARTMSLGADVHAWEIEQQGHCAMCDVLARKNPHSGFRPLYAVPNGPNEVLVGLFCWDCRTLLNERVSNKMAKSMDKVLARGSVGVLPPDK